MPVPNFEPSFIASSILTYSEFDPPIPTTLSPIDTYQVVFTDNSQFGCLIKTVRVTAAAAIRDSTTDKVIYLGINKADSGSIAIYDSLIMPGIDPIEGDIIPYVEFTFGNPLTGNGLTTNLGDQLIIAASRNTADTGLNDSVCVVVEGGTYDK
jgi:hypothetical protein